MSALPDISELLKAGVHFGHKRSKRHPKMADYIYGIRDDVHVIDLSKTIDHLGTAIDAVSDIVSKGGTILFVGTKRQAQNIIEKYASECGMPYIHKRWIGGTLTNFSVILKMIKKYLKMREKEEQGEFKKYTKKEQLEFAREIKELEESIGGISTLTKMPDALYIVDVRKEETAFREARKKRIPIIAICDSNINPCELQYPIPGNDDAIKSIDLITSLIASAVMHGRQKKTS